MRPSHPSVTVCRAGTAPIDSIRGDRGTSERLADVEGLVVHLVTIKAGSPAGPYHLHRAAQNTYFVLEGRLEVLLPDEPALLERHDGVYIPAGIPHATNGRDEQSVRVLAIYDHSTEGDFEIVDRTERSPEVDMNRPEAGAVVSRSSGPSRPLRYGRGSMHPVAGAEFGSQLDIHVNALSATSAPGPRHYHGNAANFYYVLEGSVELAAPSGPAGLRVGDSAIVPAGVRHALSRAESSPAQVLEIYAPAGADFHEVADWGRSE